MSAPTKFRTTRSITLEVLTECALGSAAASAAGFFTNPLEVAKTRLQLQGELQTRGQYTKHYRNVFHAFYTIARSEGLLALQKGLVPALWYQFVMNGSRLGIFQTFVNFGLTQPRNVDLTNPKTSSASKNFIYGAIAGIISATMGSPFYMIKTQLQSRAAAEIAVGHQHAHTSMMHAFRHVYGKSGVFGLWRGVTGAIPRVCIGSAAQMSTFPEAKRMVQSSQLVPHGTWLESMAAGFLSGIVVTLVMTPFDVVSLRLYNQHTNASGKGLLYSGFPDCVSKIMRTEGPLGFYKGWGACYFRIGPHVTLCLAFWDQLRRFWYRPDINDSDAVIVKAGGGGGGDELIIERT